MLPEIKRILYATDLTQNSAFAFQYAMDLAEKYNAQIHIVHAVEEMPASVKPIIETYLTEEQLKTLADKATQTVERIKNRLNVFCKRLQEGNPECASRVASIDVYEGFPIHVILQKTKELNCDAIVMGTHGKGRISHAFLGSVAEKVLRRAKKPVFIIPLPEEESEITIHDI